jgi:hypothetical protein
LSSAILYVAIVAIWAGVLIPRWLRRDSSERPSEDVTTAEDRPVTVDTPVAEEQPGPAEARPGAWDVRPDASWAAGARAEEGRDEEGRDEEVMRSAGDQEHARVLSARRRLLMLLLVLTAGSCALEVTGLAAWWVMGPPTAMLLGYLALLREAAKADAERRELIRSPAPNIAAKPLAPAAPPPGPPPAPDAEIIDISASVGQDGEELYDQYADAKLRAVGDLTGSVTGS